MQDADARKSGAPESRVEALFTIEQLRLVTLTKGNAVSAITVVLASSASPFFFFISDSYITKQLYP